MLVKIFGSAVYGVEAMGITIEINWMGTGIGTVIVGLPDNAVKESLQRVESGNVNPSLFYLLELAEGLNIKLPELLDFNY